MKTKLPKYHITKLPSVKLLSHYVIALIIFFVTFLTSCQKKDELLQNNQKQSEAQFRRDPKACLTPIKLFCDSILWFESQAHFNAIYQCLEDAYEAHNNWFDQQSAGMTDDEADEYALSINFDEDKPLNDFENFHHLFSYRNWLNNNDSIWVNNNLNPLEFDYSIDRILNTLLSRSRMLKIGNAILYYYKPNQLLKVYTEDCSFIERIKVEDPLSISNTSSIVINLSKFYKTLKDSCQFSISQKADTSGTHLYSNGTKKFFYFVKFEKFDASWFDLFIPTEFSYRIKAKMKNYKLINNQWKKRRVSCKVEGSQFLFDDDQNNCERITKTENLITPSVKRRELENKWRQSRYDSNLNLFISDKGYNISFGRFYIDEGSESTYGYVLPE